MKVVLTCKEEVVTLLLLLWERRGSIKTDWLSTDRISGGVKNVPSSWSVEANCGQNAIEKAYIFNYGASIFLNAVGFLPHKMLLNLTRWAIKCKLLCKNLLFSVTKKKLLLLISYYIYIKS